MPTTTETVLDAYVLSQSPDGTVILSHDCGEEIGRSTDFVGQSVTLTVLARAVTAHEWYGHDHDFSVAEPF